MRLHIIARGKIGRCAEAELVDRYLKRIKWDTKVTELPDNAGNVPAPKDTPARTIMLDEKGSQMGSVEFAKLLEKWRDDGVREVRFLIGAADGFGDAERAGADRTVSLWQGDLAAYDGARNARRAIIPRNINTCQPPLS